MLLSYCLDHLCHDVNPSISVGLVDLRAEKFSRKSTSMDIVGANNSDGGILTQLDEVGMEENNTT